jgi:hypothetical protein
MHMFMSTPPAAQFQKNDAHRKNFNWYILHDTQFLELGGAGGGDRSNSGTVVAILTRSTGTKPTPRYF